MTAQQSTLPFVRSSQTSADAADSMTDHAPTLREKVYACVARFGPLSDEAIQDLTGLNPSTQRPRRVELVQEGRIEAHPVKVRTRSGRKATAWKVTP